MAISLLSDPDARNDPPRPLLEHLLALRDMLVFGAVAWAICAVVAGCSTPWILEWLKSPAGESEELLQGLDLTTGVSTIISIAGWGGTALAFPFIVYAVLRFVFPALTNREKLVLLSILVAGTAFFLVGLGVAYSKTLPMVVVAFQKINEWFILLDVDGTELMGTRQDTTICECIGYLIVNLIIVLRLMSHSETDSSYHWHKMKHQHILRIFLDKRRYDNQ